MAAAADLHKATAVADPQEVTAGGEPPANKVAAGAPLLPLVIEVGAAGSPPMAVEVGAAGSLPLVVMVGAAGSLPLVVMVGAAGSLPYGDDSESCR
ncbi:UNVERIFIED_CONTAM: hypothetical protein FKN15_073602 [Acipenser sinensis]